MPIERDEETLVREPVLHERRTPAPEPRRMDRVALYAAGILSESLYVFILCVVAFLIAALWLAVLR